MPHGLSKHGFKGAIEPIRAAEVSFVHTVEDAKHYIDEVDSPGIAHINGDVYHMQSEESHIGEAILNAGECCSTCTSQTAIGRLLVKAL